MVREILFIGIGSLRKPSLVIVDSFKKLSELIINIVNNNEILINCVTETNAPENLHMLMHYTTTTTTVRFIRFKIRPPQPPNSANTKISDKF